MKHYKMKVNGYETLVQLSDEDAARSGHLLVEAEPVGEPELTLADNRAPSAKLVDVDPSVVIDDHTGERLIQSAKAENDERLARKQAAAKARAASNTDASDDVETKQRRVANK